MRRPRPAFVLRDEGSEAVFFQKIEKRRGGFLAVERAGMHDIEFS